MRLLAEQLRERQNDQHNKKCQHGDRDAKHADTSNRASRKANNAPGDGYWHLWWYAQVGPAKGKDTRKPHQTRRRRCEWGHCTHSYSHYSIEPAVYLVF